MVKLNRAVAVGMLYGPGAGLRKVEELAVRAKFLELASDFRTAVLAYGASADKATNTSERDYLLAQPARLYGSTR
jgi:predicted RNA polymerase sigma factor